MSARKLFQDSVLPLPSQPGATPDGLMVAAATPEHPDETLEVHFSLNIAPDVQSDLEAKIAKGEVVPPEQLEKLYTAKPDDVKALQSWLKANGYQITHTSNSGIYAKAKASQIAKSLEVNMVPVTKNGVTYTSAQNAPSLPEEVAAAVRSINGLQPFRQANKHLRLAPIAEGNRAPDGPEGPAPNIANAPPYLVSEIKGAYNANGLGVTGAGQTIAILIDTVPLSSDLTKFWAKNAVPVTMAQITEINVNGGPLPPSTGEETLDVSWASGVAPGANVRVYASGTLKFVDLDKALDRIIADLPSHPEMRQLSISLGLGETFMGGPQGEVATQHAKFLRLAAAGV